jgi:RNA methyltransferase, TrmH family
MPIMQLERSAKCSRNLSRFSCSVTISPVSGSTQWFGKFRCLLSPNSVDVHNGKAVRASMGAIFHVPVEIDVLIEALPARFSRIASLDLQGQPITSPAFRDFDCYIYGNEARGLPREALAGMNAASFTIAGTGTIDSLNVATTVNICQYELTRPA